MCFTHGPSITDRHRHVLPLDPTPTRGLPALQGAKFPSEFRPHSISHSPVSAHAFVIPKQVTPSNISLWRCRCGPARATIGHLGTPKDGHITSLPAPRWTKRAFFPPWTKTPTNGGWHMAAHQRSPLSLVPRALVPGPLCTRTYGPLLNEPGECWLDQQPLSFWLGVPGTMEEESSMR